MTVSKPIVLCDPELPPDWKPTEARRALEVQTEVARRDQQLVEPEILDMFRRAALL